MDYATTVKRLNITLNLFNNIVSNYPENLDFECDYHNKEKHDVVGMLQLYLLGFSPTTTVFYDCLPDSINYKYYILEKGTFVLGDPFNLVDWWLPSHIITTFLTVGSYKKLVSVINSYIKEYSTKINLYKEVDYIKEDNTEDITDYLDLVSPVTEIPDMLGIPTYYIKEFNYLALNYSSVVSNIYTLNKLIHATLSLFVYEYEFSPYVVSNQLRYFNQSSKEQDIINQMYSSLETFYNIPTHTTIYNDEF